MNEAVRIAPASAELFDRCVAEKIAHETGTPVELAVRIYREELHSLAQDARITQFVNVIASRRARLRLRHH